MDYAKGCQADVETWCQLNLSGCFENPALAGFVAAFPPTELMHNVSGLSDPRHFASHGVDIYRALSSVASRPLNEYGRVLDFGCGVGRFLRMLKGHPGEVYGCDIDPRHVDWVQHSLPYVHARRSATAPPLPYQGNYFDAIISISVFTHLSEQCQDQFLSELCRIARSGAEIFLTIHGPRALDRAVCEPEIRTMIDVKQGPFDHAREQFAQGKHAFILQQGHLTTAKGNALVDGPFEYGIAFTPHEYVRSHWSSWFDIIDIRSGGIHDFQDIVHLRPKGSATISFHPSNEAGDALGGKIRDVQNPAGQKPILKRVWDLWRRAIKSAGKLESYKSLKDLNRKRSALRQLMGDNSVQDMPQWVSFQNTYICNLSCPHCETHGTEERREYHNNKKHNMSEEMFGRLMREVLPTADEYTLTLSGEPLATPKVDEILEQAGQYGAKLDLITNGTTLTKQRLAKLLPRVCRIQISVDGATKHTFEAIRLGAKYEQVMRSVRVLTMASELLPPQLRPSISFSYTIMGSNVRELPLIVELAHYLNVKTVNCHFITVIFDYVKNEAIDQHMTAYNEYRLKACEVAERLGIQLNLPPPFTEINTGYDEQAGGQDMIVRRLPPAYYETLPSFSKLVEDASIESDAREIAAASVGARTQDEGLPKRELKSERKQWGRLRDSFSTSISAAEGRGEENVKYCHYLHKCIYIHASGAVGPCCIIGAPTLGDANKQSIRDIWNGVAYNDFRSRFYSDNPYDCCKGCVHIAYRPKSTFLEEIKQ